MATDPSSPLVRSLQLLGITLTALKAGHGLAESFCFIPIVLQNTDRSATLTQWRATYRAGLGVAMPSIAIGALSFAYVAFSLHRNMVAGARSALWKYYAVSSGLVFTMIPFTILMLLPVIKPLEVQESKADSHRDMDQREVRELVKSWGFRNTIRQMLPLSASVIALYAGLVL